MANINQLPYFQTKNNKETNWLARFLLKKIKKLLKEKYPYHYLIFARQDKRLELIQKLSKKYKYFLKIDIEKYYPSINHQILIKISGNVLKSRLGKMMLKTKIIPFLNQNQNNIQNKGLPLGNYLGYVLAGVYLLPLDLKITRPFLRVQDDYLIFCKNKKEPEKILKQIIEPELQKLKLQIQIKKLTSGKFHQNPVEFMGFKYYAGIFTIREKKIKLFKDNITKITHLTKKKSSKAIIKLLNNKLLGFGHYYKFAHCKQDFENLDAFIRQRLRRYISRNKDSKNKLGNLILTNETLKSMGLKLLMSIKVKYASKKRHIFKKTNKKRKKIEKLITRSDLLQSPDLNNYQQKAILKQLYELTKNVKQIRSKVNRIEKKLKD